jgi:hypothetical protein
LFCLSGRSVEVVYKKNGKSIEEIDAVDKVSVSPDGRRKTTLSESKLAGRVSTFVAERQ